MRDSLVAQTCRLVHAVLDWLCTCACIYVSGGTRTLFTLYRTSSSSPPLWTRQSGSVTGDTHALQLQHIVWQLLKQVL